MIKRLQRAIGYRVFRQQQKKIIERIAQDVDAAFWKQQSDFSAEPVLMFNASTRIIGLSQNAAFELLTHWALRMQGVPVVQIVCAAAMHPCVLGTQPDHVDKRPPCEKCIRLSNDLYQHSAVRELVYLEANCPGLDVLSMEDMVSYKVGDFPAGEIVLPSLRWILRRHHLEDTPDVRILFQRYIRTAVSLLGQFEQILDEVRPQSVVVFNGMFYPEATLKWAAQRRNLPVISHEVALRPLTAYFTTGEATAYPIDLPKDYALTTEQEARLDDYLANRMQGEFTMAGVRFWPEMKGLDEALIIKINQYKGVIPVFTNVIFDTSQGHANVLFETMFDWLDSVAELIRQHPDHLFIIRAHPDEIRPGKASRESVADWVRNRHLLDLPNVVFIPPQEPFSSYELIQRAKFVMVYNSTIGLEASILGAAVICAGKARFTQIDSVYFPPTQAEYHTLVESFIKQDKVQPPAKHRENARKFLYAQLFETSLPMDDYLENDPYLNGYTAVKAITAAALDPQNARVMRIIVDGITKGKPFLWQ